MGRKYYSVRNSKNPITEDVLKVLFGAAFSQFRGKQYFDEALGYRCADGGWIPGTLGQDPGVYFLRHLRKTNLWPIMEKLDYYSEEDIFDVIELLYDLVYEPSEGTLHEWNNCGTHYSTFNRPIGRGKFRSEINDMLSDYKAG